MKMPGGRLRNQPIFKLFDHLIVSLSDLPDTKKRRRKKTLQGKVYSEDQEASKGTGRRLSCSEAEPQAEWGKKEASGMKPWIEGGLLFVVALGLGNDRST